MAFPTIRSGMRITAAMLQGMQWQIVEQSADQTISNQTSMEPTNLRVPVQAGGEYAVWLSVSYLLSEDPADGNLQVNWSDNANGSGDRFVWGLGTLAGSASNNAETTVFRRQNIDTVTTLGSTSDNPQAYMERCHFIAGSDGDFTWQFRQQTATASSVTIQSQSVLTYVRIG